MSFSFRLFLVYFFIIGGLAWFLLHKSLETLDTSVRQSAEEVMVDTSNILAELVSQNVIEGEIQLHQIHDLIPGYLKRRINAKIYSVFKQTPDMQIYITDKTGQVIYDSTGKYEGEDFSQWNDVLLTLKGLYGARSSPIDENKKIVVDKDKIMHVAAPVYWKDDIIGVVTVSKGIRYLDPFIVTASENLKNYALVILGISILFGSLMTFWLSRSIRKLENFANQLGSGEKAERPRLREKEFRTLANAMEKMRADLEGKEYVENYIHTMAHELKTPLTGIEGSAELLESATTQEQKQRLTANIKESSHRMNRLIERMLELAKLEKRVRIDEMDNFKLKNIMQNLVNDRQGTLQNRQITIQQRFEATLELQGDPLLIEQAISNLLDNAIEFSPQKSDIIISASIKDGIQTISIDDHGQGIPDYAFNKLYDRFFSLPRPDSHKRSTGLGLSFVREIMLLHGGEVTLSNTNDGCKSNLQWPVQNYPNSLSKGDYLGQSSRCSGF